MSSLSANELAAGADPALSGPPGDRFVADENESLATRTARGSIVNAVFLAAINVLGFAKGVVGATFLDAVEYGAWGLIGVTTMVILRLGAVGFDDKYLQQDHPDSEEAFQVAFTLQCGLAAVLGVLIAVAMPAFSLLYDAPEIVAPGMTIALIMPAVALQTPLWIFWRRMDFVRQRSLQAWDPIVSLVVVVVLAVAGLGVWALVIGTLAGGYAAALAAVLASPHRLRLRYRPGALAEYASFSWPLFVGSASAITAALVPSAVASRAVGLAAVGAITLATIVGQFANRVDEVLTQALYPAICAVREDTARLFAAFTKSNRLALLWALPCGAGGALFAGDFIHYVIGEKWRFAETLIQITILTAAVNQIAFNWTAFYRALERTRPIAAADLVLLAGVLGIAVPLLARDGIDGYAIGMAIATALSLSVRLVYVSRLFPALGVLAHVGRAALPAVLGAAAVLALRAATDLERSGLAVVGELALFVAATALATAVLERALLREMVGYLRGTRAP